jgi:hypothetical protein
VLLGGCVLLGVCWVALHSQPRAAGGPPLSTANIPRLLLLTTRLCCQSGSARSGSVAALFLRHTLPCVLLFLPACWLLSTTPCMLPPTATSADAAQPAQFWRCWRCWTPRLLPTPAIRTATTINMSSLLAF